MRSAVGTAALALAACSLGGRGARVPDTPGECSINNPVFDSLGTLAGVGLTAAAVAATRDCEHAGPGSGCSTIGLLYAEAGGVLVGFLWSAIVGWHDYGECQNEAAARALTEPRCTGALAWYRTRGASGGPRCHELAGAGEDLDGCVACVLAMQIGCEADCALAGLPEPATARTCALFGRRELEACRAVARLE